MEDNTPLNANSLAKEPVSITTVDRLFNGGFISQQGREYAIKFIGASNTWTNGCTPLKILGLSFVLTCAGFFLVWYWSMMSQHFHFSTYLLSLSCCICALWAYPKKAIIQHCAIFLFAIILASFIYSIKQHFSFMSNIVCVFLWLGLLSLMLFYQNKKLMPDYYLLANVGLSFLIHALFGIEFTNPFLYSIIAAFNVVVYAMTRLNICFVALILSIIINGLMLVYATHAEPNLFTFLAIPTFIGLQLVSLALSFIHANTLFWQANIFNMCIWMMAFCIFSIATLSKEHMLPVLPLESVGLILAAMLTTVLYSLRVDKKQNDST